MAGLQAEAVGAYDVAAEPDPLRAAGHIIGELLTTALLQTYRRPEARAAQRGDILALYVWERRAIEWLLAQTARDPEIVLNLWVHDLVRAVRARREAGRA
jgi:hypothetical protein